MVIVVSVMGEFEHVLLNGLRDNFTIGHHERVMSMRDTNSKCKSNWRSCQCNSDELS